MTDKPRAAQSIYRGLRLTVVQAPGDSPCVVTLATKRTSAPWDEWSLLFPAIRVPVREVSGYQDILHTVVAAVEAVLQAERDFR